MVMQIPDGYADRSPMGNGAQMKGRKPTQKRARNHLRGAENPIKQAISSARERQKGSKFGVQNHLWRVLAKVVSVIQSHDGLAALESVGRCFDHPR
jgi:hypothetical protein